MYNIDVSYHVIDRCNKNCIACGHFAPLADPEDKGVTNEQFEQDVISIAFMKNYVNTFIITGGEPTLCNNLIDLVKIALKYFDNIRICSNGLNTNFFINNASFLNKNNIEVYLTNYNQSNSEKIFSVINRIDRYWIESLEENTVRTKFYSKHLFSYKINSSKHENCLRGACTQLRDGKLYLCQYTANIHLLFNYFKNVNFPFSEEGTYIELKGKTPEEVLNFVYNSYPEICYYCKQPTRDKGFDFDVVDLTLSKKELSEFYQQ